MTYIKKPIMQFYTITINSRLLSYCSLKPNQNWSEPCNTNTDWWGVVQTVAAIRWTAKTNQIEMNEHNN